MLTPYATGVYVRYVSPYDAVNHVFTATTVQHPTNTPFAGTCYMGSAVSALAGCDHFGVHLLYTAINKATTTAYRWMFEDPNNPGQLIASPNNIVVPTPVYTWIPPAPPSPAARPPQFGDATWMKVFGTDMTRDVPLTELTSDNPIVPQTLAQVETEWQLIQPALRCCDAMRPTPTPARTIR